LACVNRPRRTRETENPIPNPGPNPTLTPRLLLGTPIIMTTT